MDAFNTDGMRGRDREVIQEYGKVYKATVQALAVLNGSHLSEDSCEYLGAMFDDVLSEIRYAAQCALDDAQASNAADLADFRRNMIDVEG